MKKRIIVYISIIAIIIYIATPNYISGRPAMSLDRKVHIALVDISRVLDFYIYKQKKAPNNSQDVLEFAKKNGYYNQTINFFYDELGKSLKLIELKSAPNNNSLVFKEVKKGDNISIAYYMKKGKNSIIYDIYAVDSHNRFLAFGDQIIYHGSEIHLTQNNSR